MTCADGCCRTPIGIGGNGGNGMQRVLRLPVVALTLLALTVVGIDGASAARWGKDYFPNATVVTQDGKTLNFYDDLIKDKIFVISFLFTSCKDICPLATARLAELQEKLGDSLGRDIFFYSLSIDPETDTPERLKQYADNSPSSAGSGRRHRREPSRGAARSPHAIGSGH